MLLAMNEYINAGAAWLGYDLHMPHIEIPTVWSLVFIFGTLILSMGLSYAISKPNKN
jgi:tellurite resistance protein TerC